MRWINFRLSKCLLLDQFWVVKTILSRGRNRRHEPQGAGNFISGSRLAHAEINALILLPEDHPDRHNWILYTTMEPCPLCIGAIYMIGIRQFHYATRDPWAGSVNLLGATPYMSRKKIVSTKFFIKRLTKKSGVIARMLRVKETEMNF